LSGRAGDATLHASSGAAQNVLRITLADYPPPAAMKATIEDLLTRSVNAVTLSGLRLNSVSFTE